MPALVRAIHVLMHQQAQRRGWPGHIGERSDAVLRTAIGERSDAVLRTAMPGYDESTDSWLLPLARDDSLAARGFWGGGKNVGTGRRQRGERALGLFRCGPAADRHDRQRRRGDDRHRLGAARDAAAAAFQDPAGAL